MEGQAQRPRRKLARGQRPEFLRALPGRRQTRHARATSSASPANISRRKTARSTRCCPTAARRNRRSKLKRSSDQPIQKFELANGLRLLVKEDHRLPFVEFRAAFKGGVLAETADNNGITQLLAKMLLKGTRRRTAEEIATEIESVGGSIDSYGGNNSFGVNAEVLSSDFATGLDSLADVLLNPTFPRRRTGTRTRGADRRHPRAEG